MLWYKTLMVKTENTIITLKVTKMTYVNLISLIIKVVTTWNSVHSYVLSANTLNTIEIRLDK